MLSKRVFALVGLCKAIMMAALATSGLMYETCHVEQGLHHDGRDDTIGHGVIVSKASGT